jgi:hypothetical protein
VVGRDSFCETTAIGQYFLGQLARADESPARTRYIELVERLYCEVVSAGRALAGDRWDQAIWLEHMRRIIGAMMLSLVQNNRPDLLAQVDWSVDFHGRDQVAVQAANGNRVVFELVGLWCYERATGRSLEPAARARLLAVFEDLQLAQQLGNCLATLDREIDEGDRSNCVIDRAAAAWREMSVVQRFGLARDSGLLRPLHALSVSVATDELIAELYELLNRRGVDQQRALAIACLRKLVDRTAAVRDVLEHWQRRVHAAAAGLDELGFCGATSKQAQIDLLLLHLLLLKKSRVAGSGERH